MEKKKFRFGKKSEVNTPDPPAEEALTESVLEEPVVPEEIPEEISQPALQAEPSQEPIEEELSTEPELELDLESILQEFRPDNIDDVTIAEPEVLPEPEKPEETAEPISGDTVRMDFSAIRQGSYQGASPLAEEEPTQAIPTIKEEATEPFSDQWEPEYEQPMGEYIPPQPILIHPQSRLREFKKKLVNGPERRYYQLSELGTGKLQALIFITFLVVVLCAGSTVLYFLNLVDPSRMKLLIFGQILAMFLCALIGSFQLIEGLADMLRGRFSLNSLLIFSFLLCCADGFMCLHSQTRVPCCAAFTLQVFLSLFDTVYRRRTEISQMDTLRKATNLTAVRIASEPLENKNVLLREEGQVEDFMNTYHIRTLPEKVRSWYALSALVAALGVGITGWIMHGISVGLQVAAVSLLAAVPASFFICFSRPADILEKRFRKLGTLLCGWKGISKAKGSVVFPIFHKDLFPSGTVKMNGVKFFGSRDPDEIVAYGSALILCDDNGLSPLFEQVLESRNCHHLSVQNVERYRGGIGGEVRGEPVLVGTLSFLREMEVEVPEGLKVSNAVCVAVDGVLCGLFAISYERTRTPLFGLHTLTAYRRIKPTVFDGDFLICPGFLRAKFGINPKRITVADSDLRDSFSKLEPNHKEPATVLSTKGDLPSLAYGVTGARALRSANILGLIVHMAGGIIGIGIMLTLVILGATNLLTPLNVILYQLIWSIPGFLFTEWTRLI